MSPFNHVFFLCLCVTFLPSTNGYPYLGFPTTRCSFVARTHVGLKTRDGRTLICGNRQRINPGRQSTHNDISTPEPTPNTGHTGSVVAFLSLSSCYFIRYSTSSFFRFLICPIWPRESFRFDPILPPRSCSGSNSIMYACRPGWAAAPPSGVRYRKDRPFSGKKWGNIKTNREDGS